MNITRIKWIRDDEMGQYRSECGRFIITQGTVRRPGWVLLDHTKWGTTEQGSHCRKLTDAKALAEARHEA